MSEYQCCATFTRNRTRPWGLEATEVALDSRISAANWYGTGATGNRFQDEFLSGWWFVNSPSGSKWESSSKIKEFLEHEYRKFAGNIIFLVGLEARKALVQVVGLADLSFNPGWDWVVYIFYLLLTYIP